jgi:hypothetical protein
VFPENYCHEMEYLRLRFIANITNVGERGTIPATADMIEREDIDEIRW